MTQPDAPHEYSEEEIISLIYIVRNQKVMLDRDLAEMYGVGTKRLNEAVKRNITRFPEDFMFQLTSEEQKGLRSQIATLETGWGKHAKYLSYAFTEQGVAMLSSVLNSERAIQVNIRIIRVYTRIRQLLLESRDLWKKIEEIEQGMLKKDEEIKAIFKILKKFLIQESKPKAVIGFKIPGANNDA